MTDRAEYSHPGFPWYDSLWLRDFVNAKKFVSERYPNRLADFLAAFAPLRTRPDFRVQLLEGMISESAVASIRNVIHSLAPSDLQSHEIIQFGRWVVHDHPLLSELQIASVDLVSDVAGERVEPSYNFLSMYTRLGRCPVHMDAPSAKWTLDICVDQSEPWPIHFSQIVPWPEDYADDGEDWSRGILLDPRHEYSSHSLKPGEALLFSGSSQWHYREPLTPREASGFCDLLFLHFIPAGTRELCSPTNWCRLFDIPELSDIISR